MLEIKTLTNFEAVRFNQETNIYGRLISGL